MTAFNPEDYLEHLEWWAVRAGQWMMDVIDDAQAATGDPGGETAEPDGRALLAELDDLIAGGNPDADA